MQVARARLRIQAALKAHPEVLAERVERPVFIIGLGRTGSTLLHRLLALDPQVRALRYGETIDPAAAAFSSPSTRPARLARKQFALLHLLAPGLRAIHPLEADAPEECRLLLMNTFRTPIFGQWAVTSAYTQWVNGLGLENRLRVYESYRQQLQLLQWRRPPRRWVLKCPVHSTGLDALLQVFPDACLVQTHRDLAEVIPSMCSLMATLRGIYSDAVDFPRLRSHFARNLVHRTIGATLQARAEYPDRFFDILYRDLVHDPIRTVRAIYDHFGLPVSPELEVNVRDWLARNPQGKHGRHRYSLEQFGLDREAIDRLFPGYPECFGLPPLEIVRREA